MLGASAVIALPTVILAFFFGQSRIFFTVARDGLLPPSLARVSSRGTPVRITIFTAIVTSIFAGLIPLASIAALANAGTLAAFIAVCAAMLVLRRREPDRERKFRAPAATLVGAVGILGCLYLFISLPDRTQLFFLTAQVIGLVLYAIYGSRAAERARAAPWLKLAAGVQAGRRSRLFVAVLLIPAVLGSSKTIFNDGDVSWHIATGQWIIDHRSIPHTDPFSFTWVGKPWVPIEWLVGGDLRLGLSAAGYGGVAALVTAALMALHAFVYLNASRWVRTALLPIVAMDFVLVPMLLARPHLLTWPLLALWTWLMLRRPASRTARRRWSPRC